jgi:hypothetical protein
MIKNSIIFISIVFIFTASYFFQNTLNIKNLTPFNFFGDLRVYLILPIFAIYTSILLLLKLRFKQERHFVRVVFILLTFSYFFNIVLLIISSIPSIAKITSDLMYLGLFSMFPISFFSFFPINFLSLLGLNYFALKSNCIDYVYKKLVIFATINFSLWVIFVNYLVWQSQYFQYSVATFIAIVFALSQSVILGLIITSKTT